MSLMDKGAKGKMKEKSEEQQALAQFQSTAQPGAQGDAGLRFVCLPESARPRPLARALGIFYFLLGGSSWISFKLCWPVFWGVLFRL